MAKKTFSQSDQGGGASLLGGEYLHHCTNAELGTHDEMVRV